MNAMQIAPHFESCKPLPGLIPKPKMRTAETGDLIAILNQGIAHAYDLRARTKYAFWASKDRGLYNLQVTLREFCLELDAAAELMASRVGALGGVPQCTVAAAVKNSKLPCHAPAIHGAPDLGEALIRSHHLAARHSIMATTKAMQQNDRVTASIFSSFCAVQQQQARFLKTYMPEQLKTETKRDSDFSNGG